MTIAERERQACEAWANDGGNCYERERLEAAEAGFSAGWLASAEAKEAERAELERAVKQMRAELTMRAKMMVRLRDILHNITDTMEDEGDRIYFGSTNDADQLKDIVHEFDGLVWDGILSDSKGEDVYATCRAAFKRAEAAEACNRALEEQVAGLRHNFNRYSRHDRYCLSRKGAHYGEESCDCGLNDARQALGGDHAG